MATDPDRPLPPEDFDGCTCSGWFPIDNGKAAIGYEDPDCAVHAPRYRLTLAPDELED